MRPLSADEPDLHGADEIPLEELEEELELELAEADGFLVDKYALRTQPRFWLYRMAVHPETLPVVIETLLPAAKTVIDSASRLGDRRTFRLVVV